MSQKLKQEGVQSSGMPPGLPPNILTRILDFLFDKFMNLPPSLRAVAYFIFLGFFCATAWRLVAGQYVVRGVVWEGDEWATSCEVRVRSDYFSTNSKGMYYAILSPAQYYHYVSMGEISLPILCRKQEGRPKPIKGVYKVALNLWDDEFGELQLNAPMTQSTSKTVAAPSFSLISSAYADDWQGRTKQSSPPPPQPPSTATSLPSSPGDRIVVERITLGKLAESMREVEFEIKIGGKEGPLLLQGAEAGTLRLKSAVNFGNRYYFDLPQNVQGKRVSVKMEASSFFGNEEKFKFKLTEPYGKPFIVKGSQGSTLILRLASGAPTALP